MDKQESIVLKGIAILFMLYLHLFFIETTVTDNCNNLVYINGHPLAYILSRVSNPVCLYLILSGYGLFVTKNNGLKARLRRMSKLLVYYWSVTTLFVFIGHQINSDFFPGSLNAIIDNYSTLWVTYNSSCWFLCPYLLLAFFSPYLFILFGKIRCRYLFLVAWLINLSISFYISKIGYGEWIHYRLLYNLFLSIHLLFPFIIGYCLARTGAISRIKLSSSKSSILLVGLIILRCFWDTSVIQPFFMSFFIFLFLNIARPKWLDKVLSEIGKESLGMWMIHLWFSMILFQEWIYAPRYPVLVFLLLVCVSFLSAKLMDIVVYPIQKKLICLLKLE